MHGEDVKTECIRLRKDNRMSITEISQRTGIAKGTLSPWLKDFPLEPQEILNRRRDCARRITSAKKHRGLPSILYETLAKSRDYATHQKGHIAEAAVFLRLALCQMNILKPSFEGDKSDWVVLTPKTHRFVRLQVKLCALGTHGLPTVSLKQPGNGKRYSHNDFDFIVGYDLYTDIAYVWSSQEVDHLSSMVTICPEAAEAWHKIGV